MIDLRLNRRRFGAAALGLAGLAALPGPLRAAAIDTSGLTPITSGLKPIDAAERAARIARAQALMAKAGMAAIVVEPGSSLDYFTGIKWWRSERVTAAIIPASGQPVIVTPFFEEPSVRQSLGVQAEVVKLNTAAKTGKLDDLKSAVSATGGTCKNCHDNFRNK